ncbi:PucR family transcriptional regulator [Amycolatopsis anabasis]|uniref:PucR family transcriptional regulator n=1 Tax=Amycolatopsis anabasis TaxID=1840409 RepID=UPI001C55412B|nr:helix-turn-helix domain-containing protein [Amycolatopsis anabasis]
MSDEVADRVWRASQSGSRQREYVEDPVLSEADRRLNKANMTHWLVCNLQQPGRRVPPAKGTEMLIYARDLVLRGMDMNEVDSWRAAQRVGWSRWLDDCFAVTSDPAELRELVEVAANSLTTYVDDSIAAVGTYVDEIRGELGVGAQAQRHTTVQLLLQGARISRARAEEQLGYPLTGHHVAAILWADSPEDSHGLERVAECLMRVFGAARRLTLPPSTAALWLWVPASEVPPVAALARVLDDAPRVRVALGCPGADLTGFRRSHLDAAAAQRLLARIGSPRRVVRYEDVHLADLITADPARAEQFVADTLGELATADPVLQRTIRTYITEGFNASNAADRLFAHRNTVDRRLAKARALLPRRLEDDPTSVSAAIMLLELQHEPTQES